MQSILKSIDNAIELNTIYTIGQFEQRKLNIDHIAKYNRILLSVLKNRFCSSLMRKNNSVSGLSKSIIII